MKRFNNLNVLSAVRSKEGIGLTPLLEEMELLKIASSMRKSRDDFGLGVTKSAISRDSREVHLDGH